MEFTDFEGCKLDEVLNQAVVLVEDDIKNNLTIKIINSETRLVQIAKYPPLACGGTHVQSLSELGVLQLEQIKRKRGMIRIRYSLENHA